MTKATARILLLLSFALACKKAPAPEQHRTKPVQADETPIADKVIAEEDGDPSWVSGTWQESGRQHWFLFNLPGEVAELEGKPAKVLRHGKMVIHGRFVDAIFPAAEVHFVATKDRGEMQSDAPRGIYRRGAPP